MDPFCVQTIAHFVVEIVNSKKQLQWKKMIVKSAVLTAIGKAYFFSAKC